MVKLIWHKVASLLLLRLIHCIRLVAPIHMSCVASWCDRCTVGHTGIGPEMRNNKKTTTYIAPYHTCASYTQTVCLPAVITNFICPLLALTHQRTDEKCLLKDFSKKHVLPSNSLMHCLLPDQHDNDLLAAWDITNLSTQYGHGQINFVTHSLLTVWTVSSSHLLCHILCHRCTWFLSTGMC